MTDNKTGTKSKPTDYISQLKKDTQVTKENNFENEELDWHERPQSDEEDSPQQKRKGVVVDQGKVGTDKPQKLRDLFDGSDKPKSGKPRYNKDG